MSLKMGGGDNFETTSRKKPWACISKKLVQIKERERGGNARGSQAKKDGRRGQANQVPVGKALAVAGWVNKYMGGGGVNRKVARTVHERETLKV